MDIKQLRYFVTASECLNYAHAAAIHYTTRHSITHAIKSLEEEFRRKLFVIEGNRPRLTPEGELFAKKAKRVVSEFDQMIRDFSVAADDYRNQTRVSIDSCLLPRGAKARGPLDDDIASRAFIEDSDPGASGIPQLLVRYMQWLTTRILPDRRALIIAPSACRKALPLSSSRSMRLVSPIRLISPIKPERLRGLQFDMALLLDAHRYRRLSGFASRGDDFYLYGLDRFSDLLRFIIPMLPAHRDGILIIHGRPSRRVTGFQSIRRLTLANLASYTFLGHNAREDNKIPLSIPPVRLIRPIGLIGTPPHPLLKTLKTLNPLPALIPAAPPIPTFAKVA